MTTETKQANASATSHRNGGDVLIERFPQAVSLWTGKAKLSGGEIITLEAFTIDGRIVIVKQNGKQSAYAWDVFVPATDAPEIAKTLDAVAAIVAGEPVECRTKQCSYFRHYLAYGPADLTHEGFHSAEKICSEWQDRADAYFTAHPGAFEMPAGLKGAVRAAEARVRA